MEDRSQYMISKIGEIFDTILTVDKVPKVEIPGVLYLVGKVEIKIAPVLQSSFQVTSITIL